MAESNIRESFINSQIARSTNQVSTELQDETIILNVKTGKYYTLNTVGSVVWKLIEKSISAQSIIEAILSEYNVDRQQCEDDVYKILCTMQDAKIIEVTVDVSEPANESA